MRAAAALKADYPMSVVDCFAVALAAADRAVLMTGNPEIIDQSKAPLATKREWKRYQVSP